MEEHSQAASEAAGTLRHPPRALTDGELAVLSALELLIDTPREAKRLFNVYRMIRSTRDLSEASRFLGDDGRPGEYQAVIVLLALLTLDARLLTQVIDAPSAGTGTSALRGGLRARASDTPWKDFLYDIEPRRVTSNWENRVVGLLSASDVRAWHRLSAALAQADQHLTLTDLAALHLWEPRIRRFSFALSPLGAQALT